MYQVLTFFVAETGDALSFTGRRILSDDPTIGQQEANRIARELHGDIGTSGLDPVTKRQRWNIFYGGVKIVAVFQRPDPPLERMTFTRTSAPGAAPLPEDLAYTM